MPALRNLLLLAAVALGAPAAAAQAATIPVTTTADTVADDGACSLREAVFAARFDMPVQGCPAGSGEDTVALGSGTFLIAPSGGGTEDGNASGDLDTGPLTTLTVTGAGPGVTVIDAQRADRIFDVPAGSRLTLRAMTLRNGLADPGNSGGAVRNFGALAVTRVAFEGNTAGDGVPPADYADDEVSPPGQGGAISSGGTASPSLLVSDSTFTGNTAGTGYRGTSFTNGNMGRSRQGSAGGHGGAIDVAAGTADISGSTFTGNAAGRGGPQREPTTSFAGNGDGGSGGALAVQDGAATVMNSTFAANRAGEQGVGQSHSYEPNTGGSGGAAFLNGTGSLRISWSTFAGNARGADAPGGNGLEGAAIQVSASILADAAPACGVTAPPAIPNVVAAGDNSCPSARVVGDPRLGALAANGGPTPTLLPGAGSVAINALAGVPCPGTDQRGLPRPALGACDAGAVEIQPGTPQAIGAPAPGSGGGSGVRRTIRKVAIGPSAFRVKGRTPHGTTVTFRLSAAGRVVLTVRKPAAGKRSGRRCVAPTERLRSAKRCIRQVRLRGSVAKRGVVGLNRLRFSGKLRGRALPPGRYTMVLTLPKAGSAPAVSVTKGFRVLR
ncbi:MAG TPA: choice-of-anchor Q domain-containing protein [Miltoncostaeaceae bacterium]|nr:choice-of-anchor Q domain-containing protein [Miltoncostaeaceae bacterium]